MKKHLISISIFIFAVVLAGAQGLAEMQETGYKDSNPETPASISQLDTAVKTLANGLNKRLGEVKAAKAAIGQFAYRGNVVPLGNYWTSQLTGELANIPGKSYIILSGGLAGADFTISGEIIDTDAASIRLYVRLIRTENRAVEASFNFDFQKNQQIAGLLIPEGSQGGRSSSSSVAADALEPDSFESPVPYEIGTDDNMQVVNRTIHSGDEDFFLLIPSADGQLIAETTGNVDTYMEFYIADSRQKLTENDDGGRGGNARIRYDVKAGTRYIAKVRGCDSSDSGPYGFHAWLFIPVRLTPDEFEPDNDSNSAKQIEIGKPQQHNFHSSDDVDWVKFQITQPGRYVIRARGVNSIRLDTYIELFDSKMSSIDEDDDGGEGLDSRLSLRLESGLYYLKVECLDSNPDQPYIISIEAEK